MLALRGSRSARMWIALIDKRRLASKQACLAVQPDHAGRCRRNRLYWVASRQVAAQEADHVLVGDYRHDASVAKFRLDDVPPVRHHPRLEVQHRLAVWKQCIRDAPVERVVAGVAEITVIKLRRAMVFSVLEGTHCVPADHVHHLATGQTFQCPSVALVEPPRDMHSGAGKGELSRDDRCGASRPQKHAGVQGVDPDPSGGDPVTGSANLEHPGGTHVDILPARPTPRDVELAGPMAHEHDRADQGSGRRSKWHEYECDATILKPCCGDAAKRSQTLRLVNRRPGSVRRS